MIFRQALNVVIKGIDTGCGKHARLAQGAAQAMLPSPSRVNECPRACEHPTDGAAQPLRQIEPDAIAWRGHAVRCDAACDRSIENARAVHVNGEAVAMSDARHVLNGLDRPHGTAATIHGLLDADKTRARAVATWI